MTKGRQLTLKEVFAMQGKKVAVQVPNGQIQVFKVFDHCFLDDIGAFYIRDGYEHMRNYYECIEQ